MPLRGKFIPGTRSYSWRSIDAQVCCRVPCVRIFPFCDAHRNEVLFMALDRCPGLLPCAMRSYISFLRCAMKLRSIPITQRTPMCLKLRATESYYRFVSNMPLRGKFIPGTRSYSWRSIDAQVCCRAFVYFPFSQSLSGLRGA